MTTRRHLLGAAGATLLLLTSACRKETDEYGGTRAAERAGTEDAAEDTRQGAQPREAAFTTDEEAPPAALVVLEPIGESGVTGVVRFEREGDLIHVTGRVEGLSPGEHGFHVHQFGDVSDKEKGESAGGHFAPHGSPHGLPPVEQRHVGDLGNVRADENGVALIEIRDAHIQLHGENSILGRALVVHAKADDGGQPSGNADGRVAFGVVAIANPEATPR